MEPYERDAKIIGYVHEGIPDYIVYDGVTRENYDLAYCYGLARWNAGTCSKYVVAVIGEDDDGYRRMLGHVRPDRDNFADMDTCAYIVDLWEEEGCATLFERNFGGSEWSATFERIFEREYGEAMGELEATPYL